MKLLFSPAAEKYLRKLKDKNLLNRLKEALRKISQNPQIGEPKSGDLTGLLGVDVYYNKTNYEIAYRFKDDDTVLVILVGTRENFYNELKQYIKKSKAY